ncbi:MAG: 2'-5' RNA ligase family protein [Chryseolinea sp.]
MATREQKYFIAIIPPEPLYDEIAALKDKIAADYRTRGALRSPPHITLHMPFLWNEAKEEKLISTLNDFSFTNEDLTINLNGFNSFPPRVVFIDIADNQLLRDLQYQLFRYCRTKLNLFNANYRDKPFHPHITLAFRDLKKEMFSALWNSIKDERFEHSFNAREFHLLKHDGNKWNRFRQFPLRSGAQ